MIVQVSAGTMQPGWPGPVHGCHDTTQSPRPSDLVATVRGASGPRAEVVKVAGVDRVDWVLMYAVTTAE